MLYHSLIINLFMFHICSYWWPSLVAQWYRICLPTRSDRYLKVTLQWLPRKNPKFVQTWLVMVTLGKPCLWNVIWLVNLRSTWCETPPDWWIWEVRGVKRHLIGESEKYIVWNVIWLVNLRSTWLPWVLSPTPCVPYQQRTYQLSSVYGIQLVRRNLVD